MADQTEEGYMDPQERLWREREAKKHAALLAAEDATADELVGRKPNRLTIAVNVGTDDEPKFVRVTFKALKRSEFNALKDEYTPDPTDDEPNPDEDREVLGPVLISKCAAKPKLTVEQAQAIWDEWNREEALTMYAAAVQVNIGSRLEILGNV